MKRLGNSKRHEEDNAIGNGMGQGWKQGSCGVLNLCLCFATIITDSSLCRDDLLKAKLWLVAVTISFEYIVLMAG